MRSSVTFNTQGGNIKRIQIIIIINIRHHKN